MSVINNASLQEIGSKLMKADSAIIFVHENPDGDALGSSVALAKSLRALGKKAYILLEDEVPEYLSFIDTECCTLNKECIVNPDICICLDCSEYSRFESLKDSYDKGSVKLCIDHHIMEEGFGDYYYIDKDAAACAELVYKLIKCMNVEITKDIANAIYVGISTDTGGFEYSNTTYETHRIAMELMKLGIDHNDIIINLYQNKKLAALEIQSKAIEVKKMISDGKGVITYITSEMLESCNATEGDAETVIGTIRDIAGVEIAAVLKQRNDNIKVSFRAKSYADVAALAKSFGGGGHVKAAGCTLNMTMDEALVKVEEAVYKALNK